MKTRTLEDKEIRGKISKALEQALKKRGESPEEAAKLLHVRLGTMYKYLAGTMIPGGQVLWRACQHLGMVLDEEGLRSTRRRRSLALQLPISEADQFELPFINETVGGEKLRVNVRKKGSEFVQVSLRIKVAG